MELLMMLAVGAAVLGLIWLIVREPKEVQLERERRVEDFKERWKERERAEDELKLASRIVQPLVNAGIPMPEVKKPKPEKHVDTPKPKAYSGSSGSSSRSSSRSDDDSWTSTSSYSSWGGDGGSSSSYSSCDSSSSSSSSSSCD